MSKYKELQNYKNNSPESRLMILRHEMITPIASVRGFSTLLKQWIEAKETREIPENIETWINHLFEAGNNLQEILDILTGPSEQAS